MEHTITKEAYEGEIVSRLRNWRGLHLAHEGELFEEAAGEIEKLRRRLRLADAAIRSESLTLTLTDAELEAVEYAVVRGHVANAEDTATLRGLLDRLSPVTTCENDRPKPIATPTTHATPCEGTERSGCAPGLVEIAPKVNLATADLFHQEIARVHGVNDKLRAEMERLRAMAFTPVTLTDEERSLLGRLACECDHPRAWTNRALTADDRATLRGLLERTK